MCEECGKPLKEPELIVTDLYYYAANPQRYYKIKAHFKEVLAQFQRRDGKDITTETMKNIKAEVKATSHTDVAEIKCVLLKLKLTKYVETCYDYFCNHRARLAAHQARKMKTRWSPTKRETS